MFASNDDFDETSMEANHPLTDYNFSMSRTKRERTFCAICGAKATGINFDVLTVKFEIFLFVFPNSFSHWSSVFFVQSIFSTERNQTIGKEEKKNSGISFEFVFL